MRCACVAEPHGPSLSTNLHLMQSMLIVPYHMQGLQGRHLHDSQLEVNAGVRYSLITSQTEMQPYLYSIKAVQLNLKVVPSTHVLRSKLLLTMGLDYEKAAQII
jgi:hypothetical protein